MRIRQRRPTRWRAASLVPAPFSTDDPISPRCISQVANAARDWRHFERLSTLDEVGERPLRTRPNRSGRDEAGPPRDIKEQRSSDELVTAYLIFRVGGARLYPHGASGRVHLV